MNARDRLERIQRLLEERGVRDIKFVWGNTDEKPLSGVMTEIADVLEAFLDGRTRPMPLLKDGVRVHCLHTAITGWGTPQAKCDGCGATFDWRCPHGVDLHKLRCIECDRQIDWKRLPREKV